MPAYGLGQGATSGELDHDNNIGSRESDNFSVGSGFDNNPEVAAATSQNDDGNRLADKQANSEEAEVVDAATVHPVNANRVHPQSLPTFIGSSGNVATGGVVSAMTSDASGEVDREDRWGGKVPDVSIHHGGVLACWRAAGGGV